jgi:hypothetical protein
MAISFASPAANLSVAEINASLPQKDLFKPGDKFEYSSIKAYGPLLDYVFSIRYESYSAEDYIEKNLSKRFMDEFDGTPNCDSFLVYFRKKLIGSIRSCVYYPEKDYRIPVMDVFERELKENVGMDQTVVEANKFVVHPEFQRQGGVKARFSIYRNVIESAIREKARCIVVAVRPAHVKFYRMFHLHPMSDAKSYPHLNFQTVLMACHDIEAARDFIWSKTGDLSNK